MELGKQQLRIPFLHANGPRGTLRLKDSKPTPARIEPCDNQCISSEMLFGNCNEICIRHCGSEYRLRITRQDKLILTNEIVDLSIRQAGCSSELPSFQQ